jgi:hypothetical protein
MSLSLPVTLSSTIFLRFLGISIDEARLGEVAGEMLLWSGSTISETSVVTVILLMGAGHCE